MRTTLTLDDDLADLLKRRAAELGRPFKEIVNLAIRRGLASDGQSPSEKPTVRTIPIHGGLKAGIDPERINQLADALEAEETLATLQRQGLQPAKEQSGR